MDRRAVLVGLPFLAMVAVPAWADTSRAQRLIAAARQQTRQSVTYDGAYVRIPYPMGDVAPNKGVCTDVVIRAYRSALGIDLQQRVHEDMAANFRLYPKTWGLKRPDTHIDHRRVPNLEVFLRRFASVLPQTRNPGDYAPGDLVTYRLPFGQPHIAVVSDRRGGVLEGRRPWILHNIGAGPKEDDALFDYKQTGHFRYAL